MEGFSQMPQQEFFNNKKEGYECNAQPAQTCVYTAQGEMVCNKDAKVKMLAPVGVEQFVRESRPPAYHQ
jgi:hypothetical protein